jgi:nicotinamidase-related amidase
MPAGIFICDIQERFRDLISCFPSVAHCSAMLAEAAHLLDLPVAVSEQYPRAFGPTVDEVTSALHPDDPGFLRYEKLQFSLLTPEIVELLKHDPWAQVDEVVICGLETHICVAQTSAALAAAGKRVTVIADAVSSCRPSDRRVALDHLRTLPSVRVVSAEGWLYEQLGHAKHPAFKAISKLVTAPRPESGL